jgi:hypothetical protein
MPKEQIMPYTVTAQGSAPNSGTYRGEFSTKDKAMVKARSLRRAGILVKVMDPNGFYVQIADDVSDA